MYSSISPFSKKLQCQKRERYTILWRLVTSLLCSLGVTAIISLIALYPPNHFKSTLVQQIDQRNVLIKPHKDDECDLFRGRWIPDPNGSSYTSTNCAWIADWKNCFKHGRTDLGFVNWRWKPDGCELPRFDPNMFLRIVQGKRMAFIGDSLAQNQMDSLLCLLSQEVVPKEVDNDWEEGRRTLHFQSHNFTVMFLRSTFLVTNDQIVIDGSFSGFFNLQLDKIDSKLAKELPSTDYAIISDAHWFFKKHYLYENGSLTGCIYCSESNITNVPPELAIGKAFQTVLKFIKGCKNCRGLMTLLRTFSPAHFENGTWNTGGYCNRTSPLGKEEIKLEGFNWDMRNIQAKEIERSRKEGEKIGQKFAVLDVTRAMLMRPDGHPGTHWDNKWKNGTDCLHWCLPGPIDAWNDMLLAVLRNEADIILQEG